MGLPIVYQKYREEAIASYNYTDIAAGTGVVTFYGAFLGISGASVYRLVENKLYSEKVVTETTDTITGTGWTKALDLDFDVTFLRPKVIDGDVIVQLPIGMYQDSGTLVTTLMPVIKVRKWDGSTETDLKVISGAAYAQPGAGAGNYNHIACILADTPKTNFKTGETLRVTSEIWASTNSGSDTGIVYVGHDPMNRVSGAQQVEKRINFLAGPEGISTMIVAVPFKIDL